MRKDILSAIDEMIANMHSMSDSELLRIKNKQKTPYKKQKTASSKYKIQ